MQRFKSGSKKSDFEFDISVPWDYQIAKFLSITLAELKQNLPKDRQLQDTVASTCSAIRNYSVEQLFRQQNSTLTSNQLREVCYGSGFSMINGKLVQLGLCGNSYESKMKKVPIMQDNVSTEGYNGKCTLNKKPYLSKLPPFATKSRDVRVAADRLTAKSYLASLKLGGIKGAAYRFAQTPEGHLFNTKGGKFDDINLNHMSNSSMTIPNYTNSTIHGKGRSFNPQPFERFDNNADTLMFNNGAYDSQRYAKVNDKKAQDMVKKAIQDENKALGDTGKFVDTVAGSFIEVKAPKWVCSVICSNLDIDDIEKEMQVSKLSPLPKGTPELSFTGISSEELTNLNSNSYTIDYSHLSKSEPQCLETKTDANDCMKHGSELASWFMSRLLNPGAMCNYDTGDCGLLK